MKKTPFALPGLLLIDLDIYRDDRGFFVETYNKNTFDALGISVAFIQDNHSRSKRGILRGLHFQRPPFAQDKLVRVVHGEVIDIAVDMRKGSPTVGQHIAIRLSGDIPQAFFIPKGFAHGFVALSEDVDFEYKVSAPYDRASDGGVRWDDPSLAIDWTQITGLDPQSLILSEKDRALPVFDETREIFFYDE